MTDRALDLDAVQAFIRIAELGSFTRAAEAMRTTQAARRSPRQIADARKVQDRTPFAILSRKSPGNVRQPYSPSP
jgi:Bacterial regulatory helix-turn-helix protein, lysR family